MAASLPAANKLNRQLMAENKELRDQLNELKKKVEQNQ